MIEPHKQSYWQLKKKIQCKLISWQWMNERTYVVVQILPLVWIFHTTLSFSNWFEIFKAVPLSTVWKRAFPFLGCGWKIGAWLLGGFLKRIRAYQKIPVFQFFVFASHQPPLPPCSVIPLLNLGLLNPSYYFSPNPHMISQLSFFIFVGTHQDLNSQPRDLQSPSLSNWPREQSLQIHPYFFLILLPIRLRLLSVKIVIYSYCTY